MVLVIGEILMDMIGNENIDSLQVQGKLGGAPLNVASDLADLDVDTMFYGVIGKDIIGQFLKGQLRDRKANFSILLNEREDRETTIAFFLKDKGEFQFLRKNGADYDFDKETLLSLPYQNAKIIHFGSLFLSDRKARETVFECIKEYKKEDKLISFDVNYRSDIFKDTDDIVSYYKEMISYSDIVKLTKDELALLTGIDDMNNALKTFDDRKVILITDGENGSYCYLNGKLYHKASEKVNPIDTIGCGDSFMAGCLSYIHNHSLSTKENILDMLSRGNECGKRTCLVSGALHGYHSLEDVK